MGSNGSKNVAVGSSTGAEEPATPDGNRRSHSFDLHRSAATLDRCSEGTSMGTTVRHHHVNEGLRSKQGKTFGQKIKHLTKSSTNMFERKQKKIFGSLSDAGNSSSKRGDVQVEESPSSHPRIFKKNETVSQVNQPNAEDVLNSASCSRASHPNAKLRRVKSFGSSEVYSFFSSRLKRQFTSVERQQQRQTNDSPIHYAYQQEPQRSRSPNADAGGRTSYNNLSYQERQPSHAYFPQQTHCDAAFEVSNDLPTSSNTETTVSSSMSMSTSSDQSFSPRIPVLSSNPLESRASRNSRRRNTHEHHEENMSFRRTHSVGRLRDRVLRSMSTSEGSLGFLHEESAARESRRHSGRRIWESLTRSSSSRHAETTSTLAQDQLLQTLRSMNETHRQQERNASMEAAFGNPVETRRLYLEERRRRARYQVRALQRLSNSFENLAGHERSCILAGHHRTGHCTCQNIPRADNTAARANISRIIMLAEALFEVLDEIHQQSVVLSSRSSISSLGSFPAPTDIVNSMPIRVYTKEHNDVKDDTQCYICLSEYEEGDQMRVLPCHHEFHLHCIDKWLKEVHRVCPLCRGNICDGGVKNRIGVS